LDDISVFQEAVQEIDSSYMLQLFSNPRAAIEFLDETLIRPDIIFLDINMPVLGGKQVLMLIRRIKELWDVPVIMYSTTIHGADRASFLQLGADDFLKKPVQFDDVVKEVQAILDHFLINGGKPS
jgi:DNA-binding response OmpR family regulator